MDNIKDYTKTLHALRDQKYADVMIVLTGNNQRNCGYGVIGANANNAVAVIQQSCGIGYYSFGHEIGYLFAALHTIKNDPRTTLYVYAHGYCSPNTKDWKT